MHYIKNKPTNLIILILGVIILLVPLFVIIKYNTEKSKLNNFHNQQPEEIINEIEEINYIYLTPSPEVTTSPVKAKTITPISKSTPSATPTIKSYNKRYEDEDND